MALYNQIITAFTSIINGIELQHSPVQLLNDLLHANHYSPNLPTLLRAIDAANIEQCEFFLGQLNGHEPISQDMSVNDYLKTVVTNRIHEEITTQLNNLVSAVLNAAITADIENVTPKHLLFYKLIGEPNNTLSALLSPATISQCRELSQPDQIDPSNIELLLLNTDNSSPLDTLLRSLLANQDGLNNDKSVTSTKEHKIADELSSEELTSEAYKEQFSKAFQSEITKNIERLINKIQDESRGFFESESPEPKSMILPISDDIPPESDDIPEALLPEKINDNDEDGDDSENRVLPPIIASQSSDTHNIKKELMGKKKPTHDDQGKSKNTALHPSPPGYALDKEKKKTGAIPKPDKTTVSSKVTGEIVLGRATEMANKVNRQLIGDKNNKTDTDGSSSAKHPYHSKKDLPQATHEAGFIPSPVNAQADNAGEDWSLVPIAGHHQKDPRSSIFQSRDDDNKPKDDIEPPSSHPFDPHQASFSPLSVSSLNKVSSQEEHNTDLQKNKYLTLPYASFCLVQDFFKNQQSMDFLGPAIKTLSDRFLTLTTEHEPQSDILIDVNPSEEILLRSIINLLDSQQKNMHLSIKSADPFNPPSNLEEIIASHHLQLKKDIPPQKKIFNPNNGSIFSPYISTFPSYDNRNLSLSLVTLPPNSMITRFDFKDTERSKQTGTITEEKTPNDQSSSKKKNRKKKLSNQAPVNLEKKDDLQKTKKSVNPYSFSSLMKATILASFIPVVSKDLFGVNPYPSPSNTVNPYENSNRATKIFEETKLLSSNFSAASESNNMFSGGLALYGLNKSFLDAKTYSSQYYPVVSFNDFQGVGDYLSKEEASRGERVLPITFAQEQLNKDGQTKYGLNLLPMPHYYNAEHSESTGGASSSYNLQQPLHVGERSPIATSLTPVRDVAISSARYESFEQDLVRTADSLQSNADVREIALTFEHFFSIQDYIARNQKFLMLTSSVHKNFLDSFIQAQLVSGEDIKITVNGSQMHLLLTMMQAAFPTQKTMFPYSVDSSAQLSQLSYLPGLYVEEYQSASTEGFCPYIPPENNQSQMSLYHPYNQIVSKKLTLDKQAPTSTNQETITKKQPADQKDMSSTEILSQQEHAPIESDHRGPSNSIAHSNTGKLTPDSQDPASTNQETIPKKQPTDQKDSIAPEILSQQEHAPIESDHRGPSGSIVHSNTDEKLVDLNNPSQEKNFTNTLGFIVTAATVATAAIVAIAAVLIKPIRKIFLPNKSDGQTTNNTEGGDGFTHSVARPRSDDIEVPEPDRIALEFPTAKKFSNGIQEDLLTTAHANLKEFDRKDLFRVDDNISASSLPYFNIQTLDNSASPEEIKVNAQDGPPSRITNVIAQNPECKSSQSDSLKEIFEIQKNTLLDYHKNKINSTGTSLGHFKVSVKIQMDIQDSSDIDQLAKIITGLKDAGLDINQKQFKNITIKGEAMEDIAKKDSLSSDLLQQIKEVIEKAIEHRHHKSAKY